jgi:hypothetical protein
MKGTLQDYLLKRLPEYVRELCIKNEAPESYETSLSMHIRDLIYGDEDIILAYYMNIPRQTLYRFGYTNEDIDEKMDEVFSDAVYP